ncbi:SDR family NAD(P)-dependent oxidoreductase [Aquimarina hainanensis]|uniref:SDR family NAD(P)-dependent oxidoreductase n=1 Tax=Aquimarina hainanensis TaxID=1578017 RepID=A0ABW5NAF4_9FLAO
MDSFALITGASRGIGKTLSYYFAEQGYSLILISLHQNTLDKVKAEIQTKHPDVTIQTVSIDFSKPFEVSSKAQSIIEQYSTIDVLVNSAGVLFPGNTGLAVDKLSELINVNLISTITISNLVIEKMKKQGYGEVYTLGSMAGLEAVSKIAAYSATKAAIVSYSQSLYQELTPLNIQVCCLCPSVVNTDMTNDGRISNDLKIETNDLASAIHFVRTLSTGASMPIVPLRCKVIDLEKQPS